jgi:hypothetical protein
MKLFIWADPYSVSYGSSMIFAVAETVDQAKTIAKTSMAYVYGKYDDNDNHPQGTELGTPDRILDLPCAEWHAFRE